MKTILRLSIVVGFFLLLNGEPPRQVTAEVQPVDVIKAEAPVEAPKVVDTTSVAPTPAPEPKPIPVKQPTTKEEIMSAAGIPKKDWPAVDYIITKESGWRHTAVNKTSKATGLCQSLPASKMSSAGADYRTNPVTQMKWCNSYAKARYGGWWQAHNFWRNNHWW